MPRYLLNGFAALLGAELLPTELFCKNGLFALGFDFRKGLEVDGYFTGAGGYLF